MQPNSPSPVAPPIVDHSLQAPVGSRILAAIADAIIMGLIVVVVSVPLSMLLYIVLRPSGDAGMAGSIIKYGGLLFSWAYPVYFTSKTGQTPGKQIFKIKVVTEIGHSIPDMKTAIMREVLGKLVSSVVFSLGYLWILFDPKQQGWHDKIAKTLVIKAS